MGAPGLTSPIRAQGFENLQLNAGVFVPNLDMSAINSAQTMRAKVAERIAAGTTLGMTSGGGTFTIGRETRLPDVDGRRYLHKGAQFVDSMDGSLTSTLIEITPANWQHVIGTTEPLASNTATKKAYKIKTMLDDDAYLNNIVWVGDTADGQFVAIEFYNALNTADIAFTFQDKNEGKLPFELHAHQDNVLTYDVAPVRVHFLDEAETTVTIGGTFPLLANVNLPTILPAGTYKINLMLTNHQGALPCRIQLHLLDDEGTVAGGYIQFQTTSQTVYQSVTVVAGREFNKIKVAFTSGTTSATVRFGNPSIQLQE